VGSEFDATIETTAREAPATTYVSGRTRAYVVLGLFSFGIVLSVLCIAADIGQFRLCGEMIRGESIPDQEFERNDRRQAAISSMMVVQFIALVVGYLVWIYRAHASLPALGATGLEFSPKGAVGWYFAPFFNLFKPYQVMREIFNASDPRDAVEGGELWRSYSAPFLLKTWWGMFLVMNVFARSSMRLSLSAESASDFQAASVASSVTESISIVAALLAIWLVWSINSRQTARADQRLLRFND
jgi:hypothetical protein